MFMLLLRLKRYFCNHNYDFDGAVLNNNTGRWDIADCPKCGKAFRRSTPEYANPPLPLPERAVVTDGISISGEFIYHKGKLDFMCHNKDAKYSEVLAAITAVRDECQRQISNQD